LLVRAIALTASSNTEPVVANSLICVDDNIITLANSDTKFGGLERYNRDEVAGDNREWMVVKGNVEMVVGAGID
jgi:hypothetical protein